jgi:hypothetical protein
VRPRYRSAAFQELARGKALLTIGKTKYAQKIIYFFCRPCAEYHLKTHSHYHAMKRRALKRRKEKEARTAANPAPSANI